MAAPSLPHDASSVDALRSAVDAMDALVTLLDPEGRVLHVNHAWRVAVATGVVPATDPAALVPDGSAREVDPEIAAGVRDVLAGRRDQFEAEHRHGPSGAERWLSLRALPLAVDGVGAIVVHTDVTARHLAERTAPADRPDRATGLTTRRGLERRLSRLLPTTPVGVVAVHVVTATDGRAPHADAPGPAADDAGLHETAELLHRLLGPEAIPGRYDVDVLVVLLPGADAASLRTSTLAVEAGWKARLGHRPDLAVVVGAWPAAPGGDAHHALARAVARVRPVAPDEHGAAAGPDDAHGWDDGFSPLRRPAPSPVPRSAPRSAGAAGPRSPGARRPPAHA